MGRYNYLNQRCTNVPGATNEYMHMLPQGGVLGGSSQHVDGVSLAHESGGAVQAQQRTVDTAIREVGTYVTIPIASK